MIMYKIGLTLSVVFLLISLGVLLLQPRSAPLACTVRKQKESGFGSYGVAVSPGGMFVAVPKNALPAGTEYVK